MHYPLYLPSLSNIYESSLMCPTTERILWISSTVLSKGKFEMISLENVAAQITKGAVLTSSSAAFTLWSGSTQGACGPKLPNKL